MVDLLRLLINLTKMEVGVDLTTTTTTEEIEVLELKQQVLHCVLPQEHMYSCCISSSQ